MVLSGDDLTGISSVRLAMLKKLLPPTGMAARFADDSLRVGTISYPDRKMICLFNWEDQPQTISFALSRPCQISDFWTEEKLGRHQGEFRAAAMPPHSARLLECRAIAFDKKQGRVRAA
jgi:alpha-galactosidase